MRVSLTVIVLEASSCSFGRSPSLSGYLPEASGFCELAPVPGAWECLPCYDPFGSSLCAVFLAPTVQPDPPPDSPGKWGWVVCVW